MSGGLPVGPVLIVGGTSGPSGAFGTTVTYADVVASGVVSGAWDGQVDAARRACLAGTVAAADDALLRAAAHAFRVGHGLEAGADLLAWLDDRRLDVESWRRHLVGTLSIGGSDAAVDPDDLLDALRMETFASGYWHEQAVEVARGVAACIESGRLDGGPAPRLRDGLVAQASLVARELDGETVDRLLAREAFTRTRLRVTGCRFGSVPAAREAVLCGAVDGMGPDEVRSRSGGAAIDWEAPADTLSAGLASRLLCADLGQPVGPIEHADGLDVLWVVERCVPDATDPVARWEAAERLVVERLDAWLAGRLQWVGPT